MQYGALEKKPGGTKADQDHVARGQLLPSRPVHAAGSHNKGASYNSHDAVGCDDDLKGWNVTSWHLLLAILLLPTTIASTVNHFGHTCQDIFRWYRSVAALEDWIMSHVDTWWYMIFFPVSFCICDSPVENICVFSPSLLVSSEQDST